MDSMTLVSFSKTPSSPSSSLLRGGCGSVNFKLGLFPSSCTPLQILRLKAWNTTRRPSTTSLQLQQHHLMKHHVRGIQEGIHKKYDKKYLVNVASAQPLEPQSQPYVGQKIDWDSVKNALDALYRFSRPHTMKGTALSIISMSLLTIQKLSDFTPSFFIGASEAVVAAVLMNLYMVGLNQLTDIEIDKVNKPDLPLASGEYSYGAGFLIVIYSAIMSFFLSWIVGSWPLFWALLICFSLATAYSIDLPQFRWKRFPLVAAMCILAVRALVFPPAYYLHMQTHVHGRPPFIPRALGFAVTVMTFFSIVIALFKDIPDIEGDEIFGIQSFSVRLGQKRIFWLCIGLLETAYTIAVLVGATSIYPWSKYITVCGHSVLALILWYKAKSLDLKSKGAITSFYMFIWKLFYTEYMLIPFVRFVVFVGKIGQWGPTMAAIQ